MTTSMRLAFALQALELRAARVNRRRDVWVTCFCSSCAYTDRDLAWFRSPIGGVA